MKQCIDDTEDYYANRIERLVHLAYPAANEELYNAMPVDAFIKGFMNKRVALFVADQMPPPVSLNGAVKRVKSHVSNHTASENSEVSRRMVQ